MIRRATWLSAGRCDKRRFCHYVAHQTREAHAGDRDPRLVAFVARKPVRVATVAMANHTARVVWAIIVRGETYRAGHQPRLAA